MEKKVDAQKKVQEIGDRLFMDRTTVARRIKKHIDKWTCFDNQGIN